MLAIALLFFPSNIVLNYEYLESISFYAAPFTLTAFEGEVFHC